MIRVTARIRTILTSTLFSMVAGVVLNATPLFAAAADETQDPPSIPGPVVNYGNRPTYPVWQIWGQFETFTLTNTSTGEEMSWSGALPGALPPTYAGGTTEVQSGDYLEISTFDNTVTLVEPGGVPPTLSNATAGLLMDSSVFFSLLPGTNVITLTYAGSSANGLINAAWA